MIITDIIIFQFRTAFRTCNNILNDIVRRTVSIRTIDTEVTPVIAHGKVIADQIFPVQNHLRMCRDLAV